jgi:hypothetical protein
MTPPAPELTVEAHPPERGRSGDVVLPAVGCCCCCCCCLHTIGGLAGGLAGTFQGLPARPRKMLDPDSPFPFRRDEFEDEGPLLPAGVLYWLMVSLLVVVTIVWPFFFGGSSFLGRGAPGRVDALWAGLFTAVMILPALQLGASILTLIAVALFYPERYLPLHRLGRITLWSFVGTMAGLGLMGGCCGVLYLAK